MQNYEILSVLYQSRNTVIHKVRSVKDNQVYAMKEYLGFSNLAYSEIKLHKQCQVAFVSKIKEVFQVDKNIVMVFEYSDAGSLQCFINEHMGIHITERVICQILIQIVYVLIYMRENKILFKGLCPDNILLLKDQVRINDFGIDNLIQHLKPAYQAPEFIIEGRFSYKSVMWQLGLILYELTTQRPFFKFDTVEQIKNTIQSGGVIVKVPSTYSKQLRFIIETCLELKEADRLDIRQLVQNETQDFKLLLKQKHFTFTYEQEEVFDFWVNNKRNRPKRASIISSNHDFKIPVEQIPQPVMPEKTQRSTITRLPATARPNTQEIKERVILNKHNFILSSKSNIQLNRTRSIVQTQRQYEFTQRPNYLEAPIRPIPQINNLIKQKLEQCVNSIGVEETRLTIHRLRSGESVKGFLTNQTYG